MTKSKRLIFKMRSIWKDPYLVSPPSWIVMFLFLFYFPFISDFFVSMSSERFSRSLNRLEKWLRHSTPAVRTANPSAVTASFVGAARYYYFFQTPCLLRLHLRPTVDAFETLNQRDWSTPKATSRHRKSSITASKNFSKTGRPRDTNQYGLYDL